MHEITDITIIGGGPTGLFASFYAGMRGATARIVDTLPQLGGQLTALYPEKYIFDVAGFPKVLAKDLVRDLAEQAAQFNFPSFLGQHVIGLEEEDGHFVLVTETDRFPTRSVLIAAGIGAFSPRRLPQKCAEEWYGRGMDVFLNRWFARYDEARDALTADGGYLLPFRHHFFLCTAEAIRTLGLDPDDPDWLRIRFDGARPADSDAWQRLRNQRLTAIRRSAPPRPDPLRLPYQYDIVKIPLKPGDEP